MWLFSLEQRAHRIKFQKKKKKFLELAFTCIYSSRLDEFQGGFVTPLNKI